MTGPPGKLSVNATIWRQVNAVENGYVPVYMVGGYVLSEAKIAFESREID